MSGDPYVYSGTSVLRNKLGLTDAAHLEAFERLMVAQRIDEGVPSGSFDLEHLRAIHRHLFQDIFEWAAEIRTTELAKGGHQFMFRRYIERGMGDIARRMAATLPYANWSVPAFAAEAGRIIGDVNYVHPFREGNSRTQLQFLKQLCKAAGRPLDLRAIDPTKWRAASRIAHDANYEPMGRAIHDALNRS
jgi:cell filamentation protein